MLYSIGRYEVRTVPPPQLHTTNPKTVLIWHAALNHHPTHYLNPTHHLPSPVSFKYPNLTISSKPLLPHPPGNLCKPCIYIVAVHIFFTNTLLCQQPHQLKNKRSRRAQSTRSTSRSRVPLLVHVLSEEGQLREGLAIV